MPFKKIRLCLKTISYLKKKQIFYQIVYRLKFIFFKKKRYPNYYSKVIQLKWQDVVFNSSSYLESKNFNFLNCKKVFHDKIDWNYSDYDKLWNYNINYFDYLNQKVITKVEGIMLMEEFSIEYSNIDWGKEPYPTSLRIMNWIKFVSKHKIKKNSLIQIIREDANRLSNNLEYHLMGNHLLENGFALFFAAVFFNDKKLFKVSKKIITAQLKEQVLKDGSHFELSPMYHQLMLIRVLDCINLISKNSLIEHCNFEKLLRDHCSRMSAWLDEITYSSGSIPCVNDSVSHVFPESKDILNYSELLGIKWDPIDLSDSGYRKVKNEIFELLIDVGQIGVSYQPGHSHADTFNFELHVNKKPLVVDTGVSTYNIGELRLQERGTQSHNTVIINEDNSSEIWAGFRVAERANVLDLLESEDQIEAVHDGYNKYGVKHYRKWKWSRNEIVINDELRSDKEVNGTALFHIHPSIEVSQEDHRFFIGDNVELILINSVNATIVPYNFAQSFSNLTESKCIAANFNESMKTILRIGDS